MVVASWLKSYKKVEKLSKILKKTSIGLKILQKPLV